jgi:hypothetical protein
MNTRIVRLSRFSAAACATVIAAVSAWAFVSSTASIERDPFQFASIMAAMPRRVLRRLQGRTATACRKKSESTYCPASWPQPRYASEAAPDRDAPVRKHFAAVRVES